MSDYVIRLMEGIDIPKVEIIEKEAYKSSWSEFAFKEEINDNGMAYYVVLTPKDNENEIIGYGGFWHILDESHITKVTIRSDFRGKGLSKILLEGMLKLAKSLNINKATLEVRVSNKAAIGLYEKLGFESSGVRPKYYADREDALIMWRNLDDVVVD